MCHISEAESSNSVLSAPSLNVHTIDFPVYACIHTVRYLHTRAYVLTHKHAHLDSAILGCTHIPNLCLCINIYGYIYMHVYMYIYIYICIYVLKYVCI